MPGGIYYAETFVTLTQSTDVLVWAGRALRIWVDDTLALSHDVRDWGTWINAAAGVRLAPGRHRVLLDDVVHAVVELTRDQFRIRRQILRPRDARPADDQRDDRKNECRDARAAQAQR